MAETTTGTVLIADADEAVVSILTSLLEAAGYRTVTAADGEDALRVARTETPILVLLDVQLPLLNGYQVCRALREARGQDLAIALVSGTRTEPADVSSGLLLGADDYIAKPFDSSELLARVAALIRRIPSSKHHPSASAGQLTKREIEILGLLAEGLSQREIAVRLSIASKTVATHIDHTLGKLGVHSRAQAVAAAYTRELIGSAR